MSIEYEAIKGRIFNIQHFAVDDGPGIRTTIFMKGCPLQCKWCHNPESQHRGFELIYRADRCKNCGACVSVCKANAQKMKNESHILSRGECTACGRCARVCSFGALERVGYDMSVEDVMSELLADRIFYETSGGGVTLSGGEPTLQPEFTVALLKACKKQHLHTSVETCGYCSKEIFDDVLKYTDLFLFDYKLTNDTAHKACTGVSNSIILDNLEELNRRGASIILRCPMIPDVNMDKEHFDGIARLSSRMENIIEINLLPYHPMGIGKSTLLGKDILYNRESFLETEDLTAVAEYIQKKISIPVKISGL